MGKKSIWQKELMSSKTTRKIFTIIGKCLLGIIALVIALLILITIIGGIADLKGKSALKKYREEAIVYINKHKAVKDNSTDQYEDEISENAWDYYTKGMEKYKEPKKSKLWKYDYNSKLTEKMLKELKENEGMEKYILDGARCKYCYIPFDYEHSEKGEFPHIIKIKKVLRASAILSANYLEKGETQKALDLITAGLYCSMDIAKGDISLIASIIQLPCFYFFLNSLELGIKTNSFNEKELDGIIEQLEYVRKNKKKLLESYYYDPFYSLFYNIKPGDYLSYYFLQNKGKNPFVRKLLFYFTERIISYKTFFSPYSDHARYMKIHTAFSKKLQDAKYWNDISDTYKDNEREFSRSVFYMMMFPDSGSFFLREHIINTEMKLVELSALVQKYRYQNGKYPEKLTDINYKDITNLIKETLTGNDLIYKKISENEVNISADKSKINTGKKRLNISSLDKYSLSVTLSNKTMSEYFSR